MKKVKKELTDLLNRISKETFYGKEEKNIHPDKGITFEYSPGKFCIKSKDPNLKHDSFMEITFTKKYKITSYREKNPFTGDIKEYDKKGIKGMCKHGILTNYVRRDPRYLLANSKDYGKVAEGLYTMTVWDKHAKELINLSKSTEGLMADVSQSVEIHIKDNNLKRIIVKNNILKKSGAVEKIFTDVTFYN